MSRVDGHVVLIDWMVPNGRATYAAPEGWIRVEGSAGVSVELVVGPSSATSVVASLPGVDLVEIRQ